MRCGAERCGAVHCGAVHCGAMAAVCTTGDDGGCALADGGTRLRRRFAEDGGGRARVFGRGGGVRRAGACGDGATAQEEGGGQARALPCCSRRGSLRRGAWRRPCRARPRPRRSRGPPPRPSRRARRRPPAAVRASISSRCGAARRAPRPNKHPRAAQQARTSRVCRARASRPASRVNTTRRPTAGGGCGRNRRAPCRGRYTREERGATAARRWRGGDDDGGDGGDDGARSLARLSLELRRDGDRLGRVRALDDLDREEQRARADDERAELLGGRPAIAAWRCVLWAAHTHTAVARRAHHTWSASYMTCRRRRRVAAVEAVEERDTVMIFIWRRGTTGTRLSSGSTGADGDSPTLV